MSYFFGGAFLAGNGLPISLPRSLTLSTRSNLENIC